MTHDPFEMSKRFQNSLLRSIKPALGSHLQNGYLLKGGNIASLFNDGVAKYFNTGAAKYIESGIGSAALGFKNFLGSSIYSNGTLLGTARSIAEIYYSVNPHLLEIQERFHRMEGIINNRHPINESIYPKLDELLESILKSFPDETDEDTAESLNELNQPKTRNMTWQELANFLATVFILLYTLYSDYQSTVQHNEKMNEMRIQTEIQEKQLEIAEQQLEAAKQLTEIQSEQLKKQQELEEAVSSFLEFIDPLIPDDQKDEDTSPESDD